VSSDFSFHLEPGLPFSRIEALWKELDESRASPFFITWTWLGPWLRLLPGRFSPRLLRVSRGGQTVAAALLFPRHERRRGFIRASQLHFNSTGDREFDSPMIEHNGFAGPLGADQRLWAEFVSWFANGNGGADELVLPGMENGVIEALPATSLLKDSRCVPAFRVSLAQLAPKGGLLSSLSRNSRQQLRRAIRDYRTQGALSCEEAATPQCALGYFEALKALHIRSWKRRGKPNAFRYPFFEQFHRALIAQGVPDRAVQLLRISAGSRPIGYLYNFRHGGKIHAYQSGFEDGDPAFRPGYISHALAIEAALAEGAEEYDFLAGSNRLKRSFGADVYAMSWCTLQQPKLKFRIEAAARAIARRLIGRLPRQAPIRAE